MLDEPATLQDALHRSQKYVVEESKAHHSKIHGMTKSCHRQENKRKPSPDEQDATKKTTTIRVQMVLPWTNDHTTEECRHQHDTRVQQYSAKPR
ncbi:unnamed protein product [Microthlaspi erraticum]|uniref:Uncharacterized protein n=1 Tax=Microthlaspi erraticum TaxID=1685480 RepID=A0A6D2LCX2_9BRAS|nr:unnamed protein product [Microthlaspi erraticum]